MRYRPFTLLLVSRTITRFGSIATSTTVLLHVAHLTEELPFATGSVAAVQLLPPSGAGSLRWTPADRFDRRRPALISETAPMLVATLLCGTSMLQQPSMTVLHVLVAASSALASVQRAALVIGGGLAITLTCLIAVLTPSLRTVNVKLDETEADIS